MITYFKLMLEKVILECRKELDSPIYLQFIECRVKQIAWWTACMYALSHSLISSLWKKGLIHSKDINGLTLTATFTFSDSPSDISASETRYNNQRSQKLSQYALLPNVNRSKYWTANTTRLVRWILEIFRVVQHEKKRNKVILRDYRH